MIGGLGLESEVVSGVGLRSGVPYLFIRLNGCPWNAVEMFFTDSLVEALERS